MTIIIDTNILLDYPQILINDNREKLILTDVLKELDGLKMHSNNEVSFKARRAAVFISRNRDKITFDNSLENWNNKVDDKLLTATKVLRDSNKEVCLITNDIYLKIKAEAENIPTKGYGGVDDYSGIMYWEVDSVNNVEDQNKLAIILNDNKLPEDIKLYNNQYLIIKDINNDNKIIEIFLFKNGELIKVKRSKIRNQWIDKISPKNPEQICLFNALNREENTILYAGGQWGKGKSFILNNYALQELEKETIKKIVYIPNNSYVKGAMELGFLPGSELEKILPSIGPLVDLVGQDYITQMIAKEQLDIVPLAYIRGRSFNNSIIIVNEAQNLTEDHLKLLIARCGEGTRIFFDGDIKQTDNQLFKDKNGLKLLLNLRKSPIYSKMFATVKLVTTERSITAQAADYLDNLDEGE